MDQTCASCGYIATRGGSSTRDCWNPDAIRWNRCRTLPHAEACGDYIAEDTLEGRLLRLSDSLRFLTLAVRIASGDLGGTILDPRYIDPPKTPRKRTKK